MKLGTHMPDDERRKPIDIEVCRTKIKVTTSKNRIKIIYISARYLKNEMQYIIHNTKTYINKQSKQKHAIKYALKHSHK